MRRTTYVERSGSWARQTMGLLAVERLSQFIHFGRNCNRFHRKRPGAVRTNEGGLVEPVRIDRPRGTSKRISGKEGGIGWNPIKSRRWQHN